MKKRSACWASKALKLPAVVMKRTIDLLPCCYHVVDGNMIAVIVVVAVAVVKSVAGVLDRG